MRGKIFKFSLILFLGLAALKVLAYDNENTHPTLTNAAIQAYNHQADKALSDEQVGWIIYGSIAEDADPRYLNHFYNPTTAQGLDDTDIFNGKPKHFSGLSAKYWVFNQQNAITGDYSYLTILANYREGNFQRAYEGVGHILHLVQDMSVPAHVRNDAHPPARPDFYESWTKDYSQVNASQDQFIRVNNLEQAFDKLASYTHNNFFSRDTIEKINLAGYKISEERLDSQNTIKYILSNTPEHYRLAILNDLSIKPFIFINKDFRLNRDYWNILSPKAIGYSAGVIDLFQKEFAKIDQEEKQKLSFLEKIKLKTAQAKNSVFYGLGDYILAEGFEVRESYAFTKAELENFIQNNIFFAEASQELTFELTQEGLEFIQTSKKTVENSAQKTMQELQKQQQILEEKLNDWVIAVQAAPLQNPEPQGLAQNQLITSQAILEVPTALKIPISLEPLVKAPEIKLNSSAQEFFSNSDIGPKFKIIFAPENIPLQNSKNLNSQTSFSGFSPGFIPTAAPLYLKVEAPIIEENSENIATSTEETATSSAEEIIIEEPENIATSTEEVATSTEQEIIQEDQEETATSSEEEIIEEDFSSDHLVISEVQIRGLSANDEFIEIYNPTDSQIDLSNYSIQYRGSNSINFSKKNFNFSNIIPNQGYFLIASGDYTGSTTPDMTQSTFNLSGIGGNIFLVSSQDFLSDETATSSLVIDRLAYGTGDYLFPETNAYITVPSDNQSLERQNPNNDSNDNASDFILKSPDDPRNSGLLSESIIEDTATSTEEIATSSEEEIIEEPLPELPPALIAIDNFATSTNSYYNIGSWEHICSGEDRLLIVAVSSKENDTAQSASYAGVEMTRLFSQTQGSHSYYTGVNLQIYYLVNPAIGANNVTITGGKQQAGFSLSLTGVDTASPIDAWAAEKYSAQNSLNLGLTTNYANSLIISAAAAGRYSGMPTIAAIGGQILLDSGQADAVYEYKNTAFAYQESQAAGDYSALWGIGNSPQGIVLGAVAIKVK